MSLNDLFEQQLRRGFTGANALSKNAMTTAARVASRNRTPGSPYATSVIDPSLDLEWGGNSDFADSPAPNTYFDYYFCGEDIRIYIEGIEDHAEFSLLPINTISWSIEQEKRPIYGMWSSTYDAVMRGTRIVQGQFSLFVKSPDYMKRALEYAADARAKGSGAYSTVRGLTEDDSNIEKYWGRNMDPSILSAGRHIFSVHPPFNFVIVYGVQNVSIAENRSLPQAADLYNRYNTDAPLMTDTNERLVESDPKDQANRSIIEAVEIVKMDTAIANDSIVVENYQFFARDCTSPPRKVGVTLGGRRGYAGVRAI